MKKLTKLTKIATVAILVTMPFTVFAQSNAKGSQSSVKVKDLGNGLFVPDYSDAELRAEGCDPKVWQDLVNQYIQARGIKKQVEETSKEQMEMETPLDEYEKCFSGALKKVDSLRKKLNRVYSFLTGDISGEDLADAVEETFTDMVCKEINKRTTQAVGSVTGAVGQAIDKGTSTVTNGIDNAVSDATNGYYKTDITGQIDKSTTRNDQEFIPEFKYDTIKNTANEYSGMFGGSSSGSSISNMMK